METTAGLVDQTEAEFRDAYRLSHAIGAGGGGEVWLATQLSLNRPVVVKFIRPELLVDEVGRKRFEREARVLSRLSHPHIIPVYEYGLRAGQPYLVMEHVAGGSLATRLAEGPLPQVEAVRLAAQIADGLDCLHREGIVHRDIKPGNILLTPDGEAKLADFGLARHATDTTLTANAPLVGTAQYVAPEVLLSTPPTPSSDLYALGVVLYQALTGRLPWPGSGDVGDLLAHRINHPPEPLGRHRPDVLPALAALVSRLLAPDAESRPAGAREVVRALDEVLETSGVAPVSRPEPRVAHDAPTPVSGTAVMPPAPPRVPSDRTRPLDPRARTHTTAVPMRAPRRAIGLVLGTLAAAALWLLVRPAEPFRLVQREVKVGSRGLEVRFTTNRPCRTAVRVDVPGEAAARVIPGGAEPATEHRASLVDLPDGAAVEVAVMFPDGTRSAFTAKTQQLVLQPLAVDRQPRRATVKIATAVPVKLQVRATPALPPLLEEDPEPAREAESGPDHRHALAVGPLQPRKAYELKARLVLEGGEERALETVALPSPLTELLALAQEVRAAHVIEGVESIEKARRASKEPVIIAPVQRLLERLRWPARRDALARAGMRLEHELTSEEKRDVYQGLQPLRVVDRYCAAHELAYRTGVERVTPTDLRWGDGPALTDVSRNIEADFPLVEGYMPWTENHMLVWTEAKKMTDVCAAVLPVPALDGVTSAELAITVSNVRASVFLLESEAFAAPLLLVPPPDVVFRSVPVTMHHTIPLRWLKPGPLSVALRLVMIAGYYKNVRSDGTVKFSNLQENCPVPQRIALSLR